MSGMVRPLTYGRMGNFLFQAATAMAYAWRHGMEFTLPDKPMKKPEWNPVYLPHLVNPGWNACLPKVEIAEKSHSYQDLPFKESWRAGNIILDGYWQSEKYFKEYRERILEAFAFKWESKPGVVSVHVRRGDYLRLTHKHPPVPISWILDAMGRSPGARFEFYTDDPDWCQAHFGGRPDVTVITGNPPEKDLEMMSQCEHQICSCSTFSWWGAWLNQNPAKKIIMPKLWFVPGYQGLDVSDIVPQGWERV